MEFRHKSKELALNPESLNIDKAGQKEGSSIQKFR